jgi:uncharacterized membrane protein YjjP (DUF1212 family)
MRKDTFYNTWQLILIGGFCSTFICTVSFSGSFIDALVVFPLGALLVAVQLFSVRNELYSNVFEYVLVMAKQVWSDSDCYLQDHHCDADEFHCCSAGINAQILLPGHCIVFGRLDLTRKPTVWYQSRFVYTSDVQGYIVLCGSLEISSRNIVSGAVRLCYALMYSLFLGFGLAIGAQVFEKIFNEQVYGPEDYTCAQTHHPDGPWYQRTASTWWGMFLFPTNLHLPQIDRVFCSLLNGPGILAFPQYASASSL